MIENLLAMFFRGANTADHLVVELLLRIDSENPGLVLDLVPRQILIRMLDFAGKYQPNRMVTNYGVPPAADQVAAAREWIEANLPSVAQT